MVWVASQDGLTHKNMGRVTVQPIFASSKKKSSSGRVFLDQVSSIQKILTRFAMPSLSLSLSLSLPHVNVPSRSLMVVSQINSNCLVKSLPR